MLVGIHHADYSSMTPLAAVASAPSLSQIFSLCLFMYGGVAAMWIFHLLKHGSFTLKGPVTNAYIAMLCISWSSFSIGMTVLNKSLASSLKSPSIISGIQMVIAMVVLGSTSFRQLWTANLREVSLWLVVPFFFAAMLCSSFYTFEYISLSLLTVVRNLTPLIVLPLERIVMPQDKKPELTSAKVIAISTMLLGCLVYAGGLPSVSMIGLGFAGLNMVLAASDRLIQRRLLTEECQSLTSSVCAIINNSVGLVPTLGLAFATHEFTKMSKEHAANWHDPRIRIMLLLSGLTGIGICYMGFECQRVVSATSFFVMQNAAKVAVVVCGIAFFGDPINSVWSIVGLGLSIVGSTMYSQASLKPQQDAPKSIAKSVV